VGIVVTLEELVKVRAEARRRGRTFVFTNGCFDVIHRGHVEILRQARSLGDMLAVGVNSDDSVRRLKGRHRPVVSEGDRAAVVAALESVDFVTLFEEDTPGELIDALVPDVLVKGSDYELEDIVGRETVESAGGKVVRVDLYGGFSTDKLFWKIARLYRDQLENGHH
jgi:rfaE bifunctional protein nucleotidyltransferase chain/domain